MTDRTRGVVPDDGTFMRRALALAEHGWGQTAPNPLVGAVVVRDGVVVGEGWHQRFGEAHAEVEALRAAGDLARGASLYVSLEPCNHHGKTPPCTDAILAAGVARVVVATRDPNAEASGGVERLRAAGVQVDVGAEETAAREINAAFLFAQHASRPFVRLKLAMSLDGAITDSKHSKGWLTGASARAEVHRMRAGCDAVAIGIGTAVTDDPLLTVRDAPAPRVSPARVVFDTSAHLPMTSRLVRTARDTPTIVVCWAPDPSHAAALAHAGVILVHAASLSEALVKLREEGIRDLLVEGGAALASSFMQEQLVDRLVIFRAPIILGAGAVNAFSALGPFDVEQAVRWRLVETKRFGDDEMTVYAPPEGNVGAI